MFKKSLLVVLSIMMVISLVACTQGDAPSSNGEVPTVDGETPAVDGEDVEGKMHIGIVTGTVSQGEDELRGAEAMIEKYGDADQGGMIKHVTYPDNFMQEAETTIAQIVGLADDPDMKVIVVNQAVPGTSAAFHEIRERRPDIILLANSSQEDTAMIEEAADLVVDPDNINRGYLMVLAAKKMGAKTFVHISFPRHMSIELLSLRRNIIEEACKDLGLTFVQETAPDPMSDVGIPGAQQFILEKMPAWVEKYGKDTAFFATNDAQTEPLLKKVAELGAIFVEPDLPSPIMGYPGAFGIELKEEAGDWEAILKKVEETVVEKGGAHRMGTWAYSYGYTATQALAEYGKNVVEGTMEKDNLEDVLKAFSEFTPGAEWNGFLFIDQVSGNEIKNHVMVYQDTYVFGEGYLGNTSVEVPEKYKEIK